MRLLISAVVLALVTIYSAQASYEIGALCPNVTDYYREFSTDNLLVDNFAISPDGATLLVSSPVGLYLYDAQILEYIGTLACGGGHYVFVWSPDGSQFASFVSPCVGIQIWSASTLELEKTLTFSEDAPFCSNPSPELPGVPSVQGLEWSPDGRYLAAIGGNPFRIWDVLMGTAVFESDSIQAACLFDQCYAAERLAWSPDGNRLAYIDNCTIQQWTIEDESFQNSLELPCDYPDWGYYFVDWSVSNRLVAGGGRDPLQLWDANTNEFLASPDVRAVLGVWSPYGTLLATATSPNTISDEISIFDTGGQLVRTFEVPNRIRQIAWHPDGQHLYVSAMDELLAGKFWLIDTETGEPVASLISCTAQKSENPSFDCATLESVDDQ
jgi:WD40 repeat protein